MSLTADELEQYILVLEARVSDIEAQMVPLAGEAEERERVAQWWDTYNAALSKAGIFAHGPHRSTQEREHTHEVVHATCAAYADFAHGPLISPAPQGHFDATLLNKDTTPLDLAPEISP